MKTILIALVFLLLGAAGIYYFQQSNSQPLPNGQQTSPTQAAAAINSYEECIAAGNPMMESYPPKCSTPDGKTFTQVISNEQEYASEIKVETPQPNQVVSSPLLIAGEAKGPWFFEANASAELFDENNTSLGVGIIQAQGEWMTEEFVPFEGKIIFSKPATARGKLVISNANPSGLPENNKELIIPVEF